MSQITTFESSQPSVSRSEPLFLMRYVKPSHIVAFEPTDDVFQLREDRKPPEEYVSFYHSVEDTLNERLKFVKQLMVNRRFNFSANSGFIHLNATEACESINIIRKIISFEECDYPHYGMYFLSNNQIDIIEAKTILLFSSTLHYQKDIL